MTQTIEPAAETLTESTTSLADAILERLNAAPSSSSDEPAQETLENPVVGDEPAPETQENDDASDDGAQPRVPRRAVAEIKAENEQLRLTQAEFDERVQAAIKEANEANERAAQLEEAETQRRQAFETYAGSDREFAELQTLAVEVGARVGADPYASVTAEEQEKLQRFRELMPRNEYQDLITERALNNYRQQMTQDYAVAIQTCPGVDPQKLAPMDSFAAINRHFYEAGAAKARADMQEENERLKAQLQGLATKANSSIRTPASGGASGAPSTGAAGSAGLGGALIERLRSQGQWDE